MRKFLSGADSFSKEEREALESIFGRVTKRLPRLGGGGADSSPLVILAHGTVNTTGGAIVAASTSTVNAAAARTGAGVTTLTLDASLGQVVANSLRCIVTPLSTVAHIVANVAKTSTTVVTVTLEVDTTGVATDGAYDFVLFRQPGL